MKRKYIGFLSILSIVFFVLIIIWNLPEIEPEPILDGKYYYIGFLLDVVFFIGIIVIICIGILLG